MIDLLKPLMVEYTWEEMPNSIKEEIIKDLLLGKQVHMWFTCTLEPTIINFYRECKEE